MWTASVLLWIHIWGCKWYLFRHCLPSQFLLFSFPRLIFFLVCIVIKETYGRKTFSHPCSFALLFWHVWLSLTVSPLATNEWSLDLSNHCLTFWPCYWSAPSVAYNLWPLVWHVDVDFCDVMRALSSFQSWWCCFSFFFSPSRSHKVHVTSSIYRNIWPHNLWYSLN